MTKREFDKIWYEIITDVQYSNCYYTIPYKFKHVPLFTYLMLRTFNGRLNTDLYNTKDINFPYKPERHVDNKVKLTVLLLIYEFCISEKIYRYF